MVVSRIYFCDTVAANYFDLVFLELTLQLFTHIFVHSSQKPWQRLHYSHFCAHSSQELSDLTTDNAAAHKDQGLRCLVKIKDLIAGDHAFSVVFEYRRCDGYGTCCKDHVVCAECLFCSVRFSNFYSVLVNQTAEAFDQSHTVFL